MQERERNPWMILIGVTAGAAVAMVVAETLAGWLGGHRATAASVEQVAIALPVPPAQLVESCNRYAAEVGDRAQLAQAEVAGDGEGAAAAVEVGVPSEGARGTLVGLSYENSKSGPARTAYRACMIREGYAS